MHGKYIAKIWKVIGIAFGKAALRGPLLSVFKAFLGKDRDSEKGKVGKDRDNLFPVTALTISPVSL